MILRFGVLVASVPAGTLSVKRTRTPDIALGVSD